MAEITIPGMFLTGDHASRPAATAVGGGSIYSCTDHDLLYQSDGATWSTWATLGGGTPGAHASTHEASGADEIDVTGLTGAGGSGAVTLIEEIILGSAGAITFDAIPNSYKHLMIEARLRHNSAVGFVGACIRVGATAVDTGNNYSFIYRRDGTTASTSAQTAQNITGIVGVSGTSATAGSFAYTQWTILHYANISFNRVVKSESNVISATGDDQIYVGGGQWLNTANAIDIIELMSTGISNSWDTGSAAWLYGIS